MANVCEAVNQIEDEAHRKYSTQKNNTLTNSPYSDYLINEYCSRVPIRFSVLAWKDRTEDLLAEQVS